MRIVLVVLGMVLIIAGIVFVGQGSGYFPYPASSFMIRAANWVYYGGAIAASGLILIFIGRR
jgi:cytochrome b subunit of formate dehydrogenase